MDGRADGQAGGRLDGQTVRRSDGQTVGRTAESVERAQPTVRPSDRPTTYSTCSTARNASCGISTAPICFMRFFPSFCFSRSLRLRVMSPP